MTTRCTSKFSRGSLRLRSLAVGLCAVAALVSCGNGDDDQASATRSPELTSTPAPTPCSVTGGSTEERRSGATPEAAPVTDVRYSEDPCPRIVFEFADHTPAYVVRYASGPFTECGSGEPVSTDGWNADAFLTVRLEPSGSVDLADAEAKQTYDGPRDIDLDGRIIKHLTVICDFEAVFEWVIGIDERHEFSVVTLDDPARIVIDISET